jgi:hypothetical protein
VLEQPIFVVQLLVIRSIRCCGSCSASWHGFAKYRAQGQPQHLTDEATKTLCIK